MPGVEPRARRLAAPALDLRQGAYARRRATGKVWRRVAWIVALGAAAHVAIGVADTVMLRIIADRHAADTRALVATMAPGIPAEGDFAGTVANMLPARAGLVPQTFLPLLARVSGALMPLGGALSVRAMTFEADTLSLDVDATRTGAGGAAQSGAGRRPRQGGHRAIARRLDPRHGEPVMRILHITRPSGLDATFARFDGWWRARSRREQVLLAVMAALLAGVVLVYGVVKPLQAMRAQAISDIITYETLDARIRAAGALAPGSAPARSGPPASVVTSAAASAGLTARTAPLPGGVRATIADGSYDSVMAWLADVGGTSGLTIRRVALQRRGAPGRVSATVDFTT
ncbi:MAG: type II secretion system protein GspM [Sphingomonas sp.]